MSPDGSPLVSVVTPCFNHGPYLDDYFRGLLAQTYENVELVIFDDGSTDDSWQRISDHVPALERKFSRVVAERHDNVGAAAEITLAVERAQGDLLCVLESDDYYLPTKLEENVRFLVEHPEAGAVHSDTDFLHPQGIERRHWHRTRGTVPAGDVYAELLAGNFVMTCAFCCRTDLFRRYVSLEEYVRRGYLARDYAWCLDLARHAPIGYIDRSLARYRVTEGSLSRPGSREDYFRFHRSIYAMKLDYLDDPRVSQALGERVQRDYHRITYQRGVELGGRDDWEESYQWLRARYPRKYRRPQHWLAVRVVRRPALWRIGQRIRAIPLLLRVFWAFRRRREQRALRAVLEPR